MDTVVPTIPGGTANDIERKMPYLTLTKCEDAPNILNDEYNSRRDVF